MVPHSVHATRSEWKLFLEFAEVTGLRTSEAIESFNLVIKLSIEGKLGEYFNENLSTLEHFTFPEKFLRTTKNADLLQGRIGESIFVRHYFSPSFTDLRDRTLKATQQLRTQA